MKKYFERPIQISSASREKTGISKPEDFKIRFSPPLELQRDMYHEMALNKVNLTYSWHNVTDFYKNTTIKYSPDSGVTWKKIIFQNGVYSYSDIDDYIKKIVESKGDDPKKIDITFIMSQYKVLIGLGQGYQLDFRGTTFGDLLGFDNKLIDKEELGSKLPNITNSIDVIYLNTDAISRSLVNGISSNTLAVIPTENLRRSFPFSYSPPVKLLSNPVSSNYIESMHFYLRDSLNRPIDMNGIDWHLELVLRSTPINSITS